jgi:hypothetical protein
MRSEQINELAAALSKAQGEMKLAELNRANPFFKSSYSTLSAVIAACQEPLSKNGLAYSQFVQRNESGLCVETMLMHSSGQYLSSVCPLIVGKQDMQGLGSAITYAKRYALQAMVGVASDEDPEDDDGNGAKDNRDGAADDQKQGKAASSPNSGPKPQGNTKPITASQIARLMKLAEIAGLPEIGLKEIVHRHGFQSRKDITMGVKYDAICKEVESWELK